MTRRQRILNRLRDEEVDRTPLLGGFLVSADHYAALAGVSEEEFCRDPRRHAIAAYRSLGVDGLILLRLPPGREGHARYRDLTEEQFHAHERTFRTAEDVLAYVDALPTPAEALARFDARAWRDRFVREAVQNQRDLGDIVWIPSQWDVIHPSFEAWYTVFGYENYLEFLILYPEAADKLFAATVEVCRAKARILVEVYRDLDIPPLVHVGTDICGKNGPVVAPAYLREHYFPQVRRALEPVVEAGFTTVWHSDGVFLPIADDILACGVSGFQGFQWEYGVRIEEIVVKRTRTGDPLTVFAGPSTARPLSVEQVRKDWDCILRAGRNRCRLFFLPANDLLPDVPAEVVQAMYRQAAEMD